MSEEEYIIQNIEIKVKDVSLKTIPFHFPIVSLIDDLTVVLNNVDEYKLVKVKKMSEEEETNGIIWVCDECGRQCTGQEEKRQHTVQKGHSIFTPIPEDQEKHEKDELVLWEDFAALENRMKAIEHYISIEKTKETPLDFLKRYKQEKSLYDTLALAYLEGELSSEEIQRLYLLAKKAQRVIVRDPDNPFEGYTPTELLTHILNFYVMQKKDHHYFDDKFQTLMQDVETYLRCYKKQE